MKRIMSAMIIAILLSSMASAFDFDSLRMVKNESERVRNDMNNNPDQITKTIWKIIGSGKSNLEFHKENRETITVGMEIGDGQITELKYGPYDEPKAYAKVSESALKEISGSNDPSQALVDAINSKEIDIQSTTFFGKIKIGAAKTALRVGNWLRKVFT